MFVQGEHNVAGEADPINGYLREDLVDASITQYGIDQCISLRKSIDSSRVLKSQLLLVSPMKRTLQTAFTCFEGLISCPWIALESIREQVLIAMLIFEYLLNLQYL